MDVEDRREKKRWRERVRKEMEKEKNEEEEVEEKEEKQKIQEKNLCDLGIGKNVLDMTLNAYSIKEKLINWI